MVIQRIVETRISQKLVPGKVVVLTGPRRTGKTYLLNQIRAGLKEKHLFWNGEDLAVHNLLESRTIENYRNILGNTELLLIDEAQKIPDIGNIIKLIIDSLPTLKIIITGSSAFDIQKVTGEPLTGRKFDFFLFPLSEQEMINSEEPQQRFDRLKQRMVLGSMPELLSIETGEDKAEYLKSLVNSYLLKDILIYERIKDSSKIFNLLKMIAYQTGSEVSLEKIGKLLSMSKNTVDRYLDLLSKVFIIFKVNSFSRNLRKEITKHSKWYFYDNGIRNAVISNFTHLDARGDVGLLWENFLVMERMKFQSNNRIITNNYFWRTYDQQEIDWVEEREGKLFGYEFKWQQQKVKVPGAWKKAYTEAEFKIISQSNYRDFIGIK